MLVHEYDDDDEENRKKNEKANQRDKEKEKTRPSFVSMHKRDETGEVQACLIEHYICMEYSSEWIYMYWTTYINNNIHLLALISKYFLSSIIIPFFIL